MPCLSAMESQPAGAGSVFVNMRLCYVQAGQAPLFMYV